MTRLIRLCAVLYFLVFAGTSFSADHVTLNIYNDIKDKNLWLYLQYAADSNSVDVSNVLPNGKYVQPWLSGAMPLSEPLTFTFKNIDGGKLFFGLMGPNSTVFLSNNAAPPSNSDAFFGFIEFAFLTTDQHVTWDISNVDQVAMLCGMRYNDKVPPPGTNVVFSKCGFGTIAQPVFLTGLLQNCGLQANPGTNAAYLACGPSLQYHKLVSPSIITAPYKAIMDNYLRALAQNSVMVTLTSDDLTGSGGPGPVNFRGTFQTPRINPAINPTDPIVLTLTGNDPAATTIYLTNQGLNGTTVFQSDSSSGMYVYQNGVQKANNVHLNWFTTPPYLGQEISSVVRNLLTAMNVGEIKYSMNAKYVQTDSSTHAAPYSGQYSNKYNQFIVANSNSYGMPYSDAASSKVQYFSSSTATVEVHALGPLDPTTRSYYDAPPINNALLRELRTLLLGQFFGNLPLSIPKHP